jgi:Fanconi-associated nuclease 1
MITTTKQCFIMKELLQSSLILFSDLDKTLPLFIRRYTAGSTYAYAMTKAIEAFRKSKDQIPECVIILQELLHQNVYLPQFRGRWYDQLALLLHVHLKNFEQVFIMWN